MERPFTVYFDTNFFIWLRKANEAVATEVVNSLNTLQVRHVLSDVIIRELLTSENKADTDKILVERIQRLELRPYCTNSYLAWEVLISPGRERKFVADLFKMFDAMLTEANSHSIIARRIARGEVNAGKMSELEKSMQPFLDKHGFSLNPEDKEKNLKAAHEFAERMISSLRETLPENPISGELKWSDDPVEDSRKLMSLLDPKDVEIVEESNQLNDSTTNSEDRPYQVASGIAGDAAKRGLAHTLRDSEHMKTFILHSSEIDLLQVDRAQMNIIKNTKPMHRLAEIGLAEHCFAASSISDVIEVVKEMKGR
jgi:hypothetical protein